MFDKLGGLQKYWYVVGNSIELKKNQSIKKKIHGVPLLLWRNKNNIIFCLLDVCPHKKSPLEVENYAKSEIRCPYHGWKFDEKGFLIDIPSDSQLTQKIKCKLSNYDIKELNGFIYVSLDSSDKTIEPFDISLEQNGKWKYYHTSKIFHTTEELLIENFMDATHTPTIHNKLIRRASNKTTHEITLTQNDCIIRASYKETVEKIAFGLRFILGKNYVVSHTDTFLLPNIVKVDYYLNGKHRFNALIACTEIEEGKILANIRLAVNFGFLNHFILKILPLVTKKVLKQDFDITEKQYNNIKSFSELKTHSVSYDKIFQKVNTLRKNIKEKKDVKKTESTSIIEITI
jgi:nitrite reductase/ring-hydroxylating ferredoxin subunit